MGIFDWLTQPKPGSTTQTTSTTLGPEQQQLFSQIFPQIQAGAKPITPFAGPTVAGFNPNQVAGQNQVVGAAQGGVTDLANAGTAAQKYFLDPARLNVTSDPNITNQASAISNNAVQDFLQHTAPGITHGNVQQAGMFAPGSKGDIALGQGQGDASRYLQQTLAKLYGDAYQGAAGRMQGAQQMNAGQMQNAATPGIMQDAVGQAQQAQAQKELDAQISQYYMPYQLQQAQITSLLQQLGLMPGSSTTSHSTGTAPQSPLLTQLLGAAAAGAGAYAKS